MNSAQIIATVTKEAVTAEEVTAVAARLAKALPVAEEPQRLEVDLAEPNLKRLVVKVIAGGLTIVVRQQHGELGLWVAAAVASVLGVELVDAQGLFKRPGSSAVADIIGHSVTEEGRQLGEKLGLLLPRIRPCVRTINF